MTSRAHRPSGASSARQDVAYFKSELEKREKFLDTVISDGMRARAVASLLLEGILSIERQETADGHHEWPEWFEGRLRRAERFFQRTRDEADAISGKGMSEETRAALAILIKEVQERVPAGENRDLHELLSAWVRQNNIPVDAVRSLKVPEGHRIVRTEVSPSGMLVPITEAADAKGKLHSDSKEEAYVDRNLAVLALARLAQFSGLTVGVRASDDPKWPFLYIELPTGQVSWQMPAAFFGGEADQCQFPVYHGTWDKHDLATKRSRLYVFGAHPAVADLPADRFIPHGGRRGKR